MFTVSAYVRIDGDENDWFDGAVAFPVLPPIGSEIRVGDRNGNPRVLRVLGIEIDGRRHGSSSPLRSEMTVSLICRE